MLLDAILSDCDSTVDAIMHAVKWSEPSTIDAQLQISKAVDRKGLTRAFESALIYGTQVRSPAISRDLPMSSLSACI